MLTNWEKGILSEIKGIIANSLSAYNIPLSEEEMTMLYDLYQFIDKTTCKVGRRKKTSIDIVQEDKDVFMQQMIDYAVELEKSQIKEVRDVIKTIGKLVEGEEKKD